MSGALQCPSCGGEQRLRNPGITSVVCQYCSTTLYREGAVLKAGREAIVGEPASALRVGRNGQVGAQRVTLVGRIRYGHGRGFWDEWYAEGDDGAPIWLTEDERAYALESPVEPLATWATKAFEIGEQLYFAGARFQVDELGEAECQGGEGQLPRGLYPGERYRYVDLSEVNGRRQLTLEIGGPDTIRAYMGEDIPATQIDFGALPEPGDAPPSVAPGAPQAPELAGHIQCASCGAGFELPAQRDPAETAACHHCGSVLALTEAGAKVLGQNPSDWRFALEIGDQGALRGEALEVVGRLGYRDAEGWRTREYLLWGERAGYRWLECDSGNYVLLRPTTLGPPLAELDATYAGDSIEIQGKAFKMFERGASTLSYVDGALPWRAGLGDRNRFFDLIAPPRIYSVEVSDDELERFIGQHIDGREALEAFGRGERWQAPTDPAAAAPNPVGRRHRIQAAIVLPFALLNLALATQTFGREVLLQQTLGSELVNPPSEIAGADGLSIETEPFVVPEGSKVLGLRTEAMVDNSWVYVGATLIDEESDVPLGGLGSEVSYYHGVEGGESWSEGSTESSAFAHAPPPGTYRLELEVEGEHQIPVTVQVTSGERLTRFPLALGLLLMLYPALLFAGHRAFERARWGLDDDD